MSRTCVRFPNGTTERYALARVDQVVWSGLGTTPDVTQLRAYLDEFPKGSNAAQAQARIAALEKGAAEQRAAEQRRGQETAEWGAVVAASTDRAAIEAFLKQWPKGQHADAARARMGVAAWIGRNGSRSCNWGRGNRRSCLAHMVWVSARTSSTNILGCLSDRAHGASRAVVDARRQLQRM